MKSPVANNGPTEAQVREWHTLANGTEPSASIVRAALRGALADRDRLLVQVREVTDERDEVRRQLRQATMDANAAERVRDDAVAQVAAYEASVQEECDQADQDAETEILMQAAHIRDLEACIASQAMQMARLREQRDAALERALTATAPAEEGKDGT